MVTALHWLATTVQYKTTGSCFIWQTPAFPTNKKKRTKWIASQPPTQDRVWLIANKGHSPNHLNRFNGLRSMWEKWKWATAKVDQRYCTIHTERPTNLPPQPPALIIWHSTWGCVKNLQFILTGKFTVGRIHKASVLWRQSGHTLEWTDLRVKQPLAETQSGL